MIHPLRLLLAFTSFWLPALLLAEETNIGDRKVKPPTSTGQFTFSLLPNSLNKNAFVHMTVLGEVTPAGAAQPQPSPQSPTYYLSQSGGYRAGGYASHSRTTPDDETITTHVQKSLRIAGYLPADEKTTPAILVVYHWGANYGGPGDSFLNRASLIGGASFAEELTDVLGREREHRITQKSLKVRQTTTVYPRSYGGYSTYPSRGGALSPTIIRHTVNSFAGFESFSPLAQYKMKDENNAALLEQARGGIYYVIISAYDYTALTRSERVLLWRTRMTVDDSGVSFKDTLPVLLANAGPYLGKDTGRAGTFTKKMLRKGSVELGPAEVIEDEVPGGDALRPRGKR